MNIIGSRGLLAVTSAALLTACASTATTTVVLAPTVASGSTSDVSSVATDLRTVAAQAYLTLASSANTKEDVALKGICGVASPDLAQAKAALLSLAGSFDDFEQGLLAIAFPPEASTDARQLARDIGQEAAVVHQAANSNSLLEMSGYTDKIPQLDAASHADSTLLRHDLGLPAGPTNPACPS